MNTEPHRDRTLEGLGVGPRSDSDRRKGARSVARVLIVEDDTALRAALAEAISAYGFKVETAVDGQQGSALLIQRSFDVVVTDLQMPVEGEVVIQMARSLVPAVPVICVTAVRDLTRRREAMGAGAFAYLVKPVTASRLNEVIREAIGVASTNGP